MAHADLSRKTDHLGDQLGVLPRGDVLKCALALARNEREARRVLLARLPTLEHQRLGGHTGGNLLLSMMESYSGNFLDAIDGLRALLGCRGKVWPVSIDKASVCAEYSDGSFEDVSDSASWTSSDPAVAVYEPVNNEVSCVAPGQATITATVPGFGGSTMVTVPP